MKMTTKLTLGLSTVALFASAAQASQAPSETMDVKATTTQTVQTIDADGQVGQLTIIRIDEDNQAVLGAIEEQRTEAYIVQNNEGDLYINHLVPYEELPDPELDVEVVDTYEITYRGMTFTNKIVNAE